jgi:hypothetical protein
MLEAALMAFVQASDDIVEAVSTGKVCALFSHTRFSSFTHTHTHTHTHTSALSLSLTFTLTLNLSLSFTHSLLHTNTVLFVCLLSNFRLRPAHARPHLMCRPFLRSCKRRSARQRSISDLPPFSCPVC